MLINLIIIYFACGSPIGVYRITRTTRLRSARQAATLGVYFVFWPVFVPAVLRRSLSVHETDIEQAIAIIRTALEKIAFAGSPTATVFEFREVFARYTGLTLALYCDSSINPRTELLKLTGHRNIAVAAACMKRRDRQRLLFHQKHARNEFVEIVSTIARESPKDIEILKLSMQLAALLNDGKIADNLSVLKKGSSG